MKPRYQPYLDTLRRVPDDVILSVATRELDMGNGHCCVCGWVLREALARAANTDADEVRHDQTFFARLKLARMYGGSEDEWGDIYFGINYYDAAPDIEEAFAIRVAEAAG